MSATNHAPAPLVAPQRDPIQQVFFAALADHKIGNLEAARRGYRGVLDLDDGHVGALAHLGDVSMGLKRDDELLSIYTRLLGQDDDEIIRGLANSDAIEAAYVMLAATCLGFERFELAETLLQLIVQRWPENMEAHNNLGTIYFNQGNFERAEVHFREGTGYQPARAEPWFNLGMTLIHKADIIGAIDALSRAIQFDPPPEGVS